MAQAGRKKINKNKNFFMFFKVSLLHLSDNQPLPD